MKRVGFVKRRFVSSALVRAPQSSHSHFKTSKPLFIVFCRTFQYFLHKNTATVGIASPLSKHHLLLYPDQISMQDGVNMIHKIWLGLYCTDAILPFSLCIWVCTDRKRKMLRFFIYQVRCACCDSLLLHPTRVSPPSFNPVLSVLTFLSTKLIQSYCHGLAFHLSIPTCSAHYSLRSSHQYTYNNARRVHPSL